VLHSDVPGCAAGISQVADSYPKCGCDARMCTIIKIVECLRDQSASKTVYRHQALQENVTVPYTSDTKVQQRKREDVVNHGISLDLTTSLVIVGGGGFRIAFIIRAIATLRQDWNTWKSVTVHRFMFLNTTIIFY
jgi:hypothetical protein